MNKFFFVPFAVFLVFFACQTKKETQAHAVEPNETNDLPQMTLTFKGHSPISTKSLEGKVVLIFFQPDCDHCQREAKEISEHLESFSRHKVYFITTENFNLIDEFANDYGLSDKTNIHFSKTTLTEILNTVGQISAPSMFIYEDKKLIKHLDGETPITEILKYL